MQREQVKLLLEKIDKYIPVYIIEKELKMPANTLQKALRETEDRGLPKKWVKPLTEFVNLKKWITISYLKPKVKNNSDKSNSEDAVGKNGSSEENKKQVAKPTSLPVPNSIIEEKTSYTPIELIRRKKLGLK